MRYLRWGINLDCVITPEHCRAHGEELPCRECYKAKLIREKNERLEREHRALPIRRPKVLEQK